MLFHKIEPKMLSGNVFSMLDNQWMLITAGDETYTNMMTASWGALGFVWGMPVSHCYVRPTRHTYAMMEKVQEYTLCFFPEIYRDQLKLCGAKSGRDMDKVKECGFHVAYTEHGSPYFEEASLVLVCRKLYWHDIDPARFIDGTLDARHYPLHDYHREYVGEITAVLTKTEEAPSKTK